MMRSSAIYLTRQKDIAIKICSNCSVKSTILTFRGLSTKTFDDINKNNHASRNLSSLPAATSFENNHIKNEDEHHLNPNYRLTLRSKHKVKPLSEPSPVARITIPERHAISELTPNNDAAATLTPSPSHLTFTGGSIMPITSTLKIVVPGVDDLPRGVWPVFRIMDENGQFRNPSSDGYEQNDAASSTPPHSPLPPTTSTPDDVQHRLAVLRSALVSQFPAHSAVILESNLLQPARLPFADTQSPNTLLRAHRHMIRLRQMDNILQNAQRQGRISFYMSCRGEEAIHIGSASALEPQDVVLAQYREAGLLMWRGFTLEQFTNQCFSNDLDLGRGRQMPVHYGSRALNYHTISSPLGTQLPQAVGVAYKLKQDMMAEGKGRQSIAVTFFGDGCASTTDFHSACNFAATLKTPVIFFCRNNGYAISTPVTDQYAGDGIIARAPGYGMAGIRVDGNDIFAVHAAVKAAREYALQHSAPVFIEAMTYRQSHHSTSDDSTRYREAEEVKYFGTKSDPLNRMNLFLSNQDWMHSDQVAEIRDEERMAVLKAMEKAERRPKPKLSTLFEDVYNEMPLHLKRQEMELMTHIEKYPDKYSAGH